MSDTTTPDKPEVTTPVTPAPKPSLSRSEASARLNKSIEFYAQFAGKRGYNPHFKLNELHALGERLVNNDTAAAAITAIAELPTPTESDVALKGTLMQNVRESAKATTAAAPKAASPIAAAALKRA